MNLTAYVQDEQLRNVRDARAQEARLARELNQLRKAQQQPNVARPSNNRESVLGKSGKLNPAI